MTTAGFPRFSAEEMQRRIRAVDEMMLESGVDHLIAYGAHRSGSAVQWLTGWPVTREGVLVHTPGETDTLLVHFYNHIPQASQIADKTTVRWAGPRTGDALLEELSLRGTESTARLGVVGPLPFQLHDRLCATRERVVDLNPNYTQLRLTKSTEEISWLRQAAVLTDQSCAALRDHAAPGMTEHELVALVEGAYLAQGGSNYIHYFSITAMGAPVQCVPAQWPTNRQLEVGDALSCELSTSYGVDYPGQLLRTFTVGAQPTALYSELHAVADEALTRIEAILAPGVKPAQVVKAASVIEEAGFTTVDDLVHGLGGGYLPPVFGSSSRTLEPLPELSLIEGMTVVVQPNVTTPDKRAGVQTGELFLVTADGCEPLHKFPRGMGRVG